MSLDNLQEYARRCATDPDLRAAARAIGMTDMEEHMRHAGSLGLDWTRADLVAFRKEVIGDDEVDDLVDLTEEELERVAGGAVAASLAAAVMVSGVVGAGVAQVAATAAVGGATAAGRGGW